MVVPISTLEADIDAELKAARRLRAAGVLQTLEEQRPEITFRRGSHVDFPSEKKRIRKLEGALDTALEGELIQSTSTQSGVPTVTPGASIATTRISGTHLRKSKTPAKRKRVSTTRRKNLRQTLVASLRKEKREIKKRLKEIERDLRSLHAR